MVEEASGEQIFRMSGIQAGDTDTECQLFSTYFTQKKKKLKYIMFELSK